MQDVGEGSPLFLLVGLGELGRLVLLALVGASSLMDTAAGPLATAAWLLVFLAPHAALAAAFLFMARPSGSMLWLRLVVPAKLIGLAAAATACGAEVTGGDWLTVTLSMLGTPLPTWLFFGAVAAWDGAVLAALAIRAVSLRLRRPQQPPEPPGAPSADFSSNPPFREADVVVVEEPGTDRT